MLLLPGSFITLNLQAQIPVPEYLYAHFDKDFYVAGEDIWFSLHFLEPSTRQSEIVYAELFSPDGELVTRHTLKVENDLAVGDFILPANLPEAYYSFRAYTKWNLNFSPKIFFEAQLPVYNAVRNISKLPALSDKSDFTPKQDENLGLQLEKEVFKPREMVKLQVNNKYNSLMHVSVSVTDLAYREANEKNGPEAYKNRLISSPTPTLVSEKELWNAETSLQKIFKLRHPEDKELVNSSFIMGFVKSTHQKLIRIAEDGIVDFPLENFYDSTVIQIFDASPFQATYIPLIDAVEEDWELPDPVIKEGSPPLTDQVRHYILRYQNRFQVSKLFGNLDLIRARPRKIATSQFTPTNTYVVNNYIDLDGMAEFIKQAVPPITYKPGKYKKGKYILPQLKLYVPHKEPFYNKRVIKKPAVFLVNDYFSYDVEAVLGMEWSTVERVEVYNTVQTLPSQFGPIGDFGVIAFITRDGETPESIRETGNNVKISGFYRPRLVKTIDYETIAQKNSRIPDFRPMIFWNPQVPIAPGQNNEIKFPTGDQHGKYLIRVQGVSVSGDIIAAEKVIEVSYVP